MVGAGLVSLAALGAFVTWEAHSTHPMLKMKFFHDRRFSIAAAGECFGVFGLVEALFVQTQFFQFDLGNSPLRAGLAILPMAAALVVSAALSPIVARVSRCQSTVASGSAAIAGGLWQISATAGLRHHLRRCAYPACCCWESEPGCCCRRRRTPWWGRYLRA